MRRLCRADGREGGIVWVEGFWLLVRAVRSIDIELWFYCGHWVVVPRKGEGGRKVREGALVGTIYTSCTLNLTHLLVGTTYSVCGLGEKRRDKRGNGIKHTHTHKS